MMDLINWSYYICAALFLLLSWAVVRNLKCSLALFNQIPGRYWLFLSSLFLVALFLRLYIVPHQHYVFYDEYEHINVAKNMAEQRQFARCNLYLDGQCLSADLPQWTPGYHFLLSIIFNIFGATESVAYNFNAVLGALATIFIFLILYLITQSREMASLSAVLLAFTPLHLKFSGNSSTEIVSSLFILWSVLALLIFTKRKTDESFIQLIAITAYTLLLRPENGLLLFLSAVWLLASKVDYKNYSKLAGWMILFMPYFLYLMPIHEYRQEYWLQGRQGSAGLSILLDNVLFWVSNKSVPLICILTAVVGGYYAFKKYKLTLVWLFLFFFSFTLSYTMASLNLKTGEHQRFILQYYLPLIILASMGYYYSWQRACSYLKNKGLILGILTLITVWNYNQAFHYLFAKTSPSFFQQQHQLFLKGKNIDNRYVFVAYNPSSIISTTGKSCAHISYILDDNIYRSRFKDRDLILVNDYWCDSDSFGFCSRLKSEYILEKIEFPRQDVPESMFFLIKKRD